MDIIKRKNTRCTVKDSSLCKWMNKENCEGCYVMELSDKEQEEALEKWEVTQSLLPDSVDKLADSETCHFCRRDPQKRSCYAVVDFANPEPESTKPMFFGIGKKVRSKIGSLLPVSIACCSRCRKTFILYDAIKFIVPVLVIALAVILLVIPPIGKAIASISEFASYILLLFALAIGVVLGKYLSFVYFREKSKDVRLNVFEIPIVAQMGEKGWFLLQEETDVTRMIFTKKKFAGSKQLKYENDQTEL